MVALSHLQAENAVDEANKDMEATEYSRDSAQTV
jgi:hypothetical protein